MEDVPESMGWNVILAYLEQTHTLKSVWLHNETLKNITSNKILLSHGLHLIMFLIHNFMNSLTILNYILLFRGKLLLLTI